MQRGQLVLICAVVIHRPDLFVSAARADKGDLRGGDARQASGKPRDDFVGKLVREARVSASRGLSVIDAAHDRRRGNVLHVVEPCLDRAFPVGRQDCQKPEIARRPERCSRPGSSVRWGAGHLRGIETLAGQVQDSAEVEIVAQDIAEQRCKRLRRRVSGTKSATATRGLLTPRPVPVRNQSCAAAVRAAQQQRSQKRTRDASRAARLVCRLAQRCDRSRFISAPSARGAGPWSHRLLTAGNRTRTPPTLCRRYIRPATDSPDWNLSRAAPNCPPKRCRSIAGSAHS